MTDMRGSWFVSFMASGLVILSEFVIGISSFIFYRSSRFWDRKRLLPLRFFEFVFPLLDAVVVDAAKREQFFLVVNHLLAAGAGQRIVFHQEDSFLRTDLL